MKVIIMILDIIRFTANRNVFFFFKQKTAYEMRISDWSSDVCSSDLLADWLAAARATAARALVADSRSRSALYQAVGKAWDFALVADAQPSALADLLDDAGLTLQARAPMPPVVKLVFGAN